MKNVKKFKEFSLSESFVLTSDQIPKIGDVVDKIDYKEGDTFAFIDFAGVKNIPVQIVNNDDNTINTTNESIFKRADCSLKYTEIPEPLSIINYDGKERMVYSVDFKQGDKFAFIDIGDIKKIKVKVIY